MRLWAKSENERNFRISKVRMVSSQSKFPVPRITRTNWARKMISASESGTTKKRMRRAVSERTTKKSFPFFSAAKRLKEGKTAREKAMPKRPSGTLWMLLAKMKAARLPDASVEAKAVIASRLIWLTPMLNDRGIMRVITRRTEASFQIRRLARVARKPALFRAGYWMSIWRNAPKTTPHASPIGPKEGARNQAPKMMPRLEKKGAHK